MKQIKKIKKIKDAMETNNISLSSPWVLYCRELEAMFGKDEEITITPCMDEPSITLSVSNAKKAAALRLILPETCEFGNVTLKIDIVNATPVFYDISEVYAAAFEGNPAFEGVLTSDPDGLIPKRSFIMFDRDPAQFFADDIGDPNGYRTMLYQDIAKDIFKGFDPDLGEMVFYCTER